VTALIPILGAVIRTRSRREKSIWKIDGWYKKSYNEAMLWESELRRLQIWIDEYTEGNFYLDLTLVAFEDEKDFIIFTLWFKGIE